MGHHKAQLRSRVSFTPQKSKRYAVDTPGVRRYAYTYQTDSSFATEFPLTSDDLGKLSAFVREFEHCALSYWLGQHYERRKGRLKFDIGEMSVVQPYFGRETRVVPDWRLGRPRGWRLISLMRRNREAWEYYTRAFKRVAAIDGIRRAHEQRVIKRAAAIKAIRGLRRKQRPIQVNELPRIGHESQ